MLDERVKILCEQASTEKDPDKLAELVKEINDLLEEKQRRLTEELFADAKIHAMRQRPTKQDAPADEA
jgi:hypothetical protein